MLCFISKEWVLNIKHDYLGLVLAILPCPSPLNFDLIVLRRVEVEVEMGFATYLMILHY